jgi:hypothetical protein
MKPKQWWLGLVLLIGVITLGWTIEFTVAQQGMQSQQMEMMKKMMMNRPKAMKKADDSVQQQKQKAMKSGKYACCLKHPCDHCALKMGECPCGMNAAKDMAVCNECKGGWAAGDGVVPGKTPDQIKTMPRMDMGMGK